MTEAIVSAIILRTACDAQLPLAISSGRAVPLMWDAGRGPAAGEMHLNETARI